jgi:hypothetical protein
MPALATLNRDGVILGIREHVYTKEVSTMAGLMAYMELTFVSTVQRGSHFLRCRMHYGHPDVFHKLSILGNGGMSKGSRKVKQSHPHDLSLQTWWDLHFAPTHAPEHVCCG